MNNLNKFFLIGMILAFTNLNANQEKIPAEYFACYSNSYEMQMSPDGEYLTIVSPPRENKCDIESDLRKDNDVVDEFNNQSETGIISYLLFEDNKIKIDQENLPNYIKINNDIIIIVPII